jgi:hypothetical protein
MELIIQRAIRVRVSEPKYCEGMNRGEYDKPIKHSISRDTIST